jgi:hypothetical protein
MTEHAEDSPGERYLKDRLEPQIAWFEAKSAASKRRFQSLNTVQVTLPLLVPLFNLAGKDQPYLIAAAICGAAASAAAAFSIQGRYQENWGRYRATASLLTSLAMRYRHRVPPFDAPDRDSQLVGEAEALMQKEATDWLQDVSKPTKKSDRS